MSYDQDQLLDAAKEVRANAHAPYSGFFVGVAVQDDRGRRYVGCNVENSSFPEGICAEAAAIGAMVADGGQRIAAIAAVGGKSELEFCAPCGGCRQRILEFADDHTRIIYLDSGGKFANVAISELLPASFRLSR